MNHQPLNVYWWFMMVWLLGRAYQQTTPYNQIPGVYENGPPIMPHDCEGVWNFTSTSNANVHPGWTSPGWFIRAQLVSCCAAIRCGSSTACQSAPLMRPCTIPTSQAGRHWSPTSWLQSCYTKCWAWIPYKMAISYILILFISKTWFVLYGDCLKRVASMHAFRASYDAK